MTGPPGRSPRVTDRIQLTPVAIHEGAAVADTMFGEARPHDGGFPGVVTAGAAHFGWVAPMADVTAHMDATPGGTRYVKWSLAATLPPSVSVVPLLRYVLSMQLGLWGAVCPCVEGGVFFFLWLRRLCFLTCLHSVVCVRNPTAPQAAAQTTDMWRPPCSPCLRSAPWGSSRRLPPSSTRSWPSTRPASRPGCPTSPPVASPPLL